MRNIICRIKNRIRLEKRWLVEYKKYAKNGNVNNRIFLVNTPEHGNLGDHALALATINLLHELVPEYEIVELPGSLLRDFSTKKLKNLIKKNTILINAGGYLGTLWMLEEQTVRKILDTFYENTIVVMPQTITYSGDEIGQAEKKISKEYYKRCKNIYLFVRDEKSLLEGRELLDDKRVFLAPDMVVGYLSIDNIRKKREKKCLLCLRQDVEKIINSTMIDYFRETICEKIKGIAIYETDTVIQRGINRVQREEIVNLKLEEFASAQVIITDRLHGMLFAAVSGTPCVVLNNSNGKVKGVYNWIREVPYIRFIEDVNDFEVALEDVLMYENNEYPIELMKKKYIDMKEKLASIFSTNTNVKKLS